MNYLKKIFSICSVMVFFFAASNSNVFAFSFGPNDGLTGAPGEGNCTQCHSGNSLNASGGTLVLGVPGTYLPGEMYDIVVDLSRSGQSRWGFEMTALNGNGARAGTFANADGNTQVTEENSKQYIKQTSAGSAHGTRNKNQWIFKWTAPTNDVGPITFYAAGNAANGDGRTSGDYIYTQKATSEVPVYGVTLAGVGSLKTETTDANAAVTYTLKVTNTSNTNDTINLSTSGDASATLSPTTVPLDAGAARNVTLTVSGNALTTAGDYEVKVKATSQGDSTKTAEVTTTTTVPPVYGVTLVGVGTLTRETANASNVSYTLRVTNTGNTSDTVRLTTSGDVTATLSRTLIPLDYGKSSVVSVSIRGDALTAAGDYAVKVIATSQGDTQKTAEVTTTTTVLPVYGVTLTGVGELTTETADASEGVSYMLTVTNTGNTDDVIDLTSSNDAATLSQASVSLAAGASTEVTITISGDALATAGDYEVNVTATSQGDNTMSSEVSTNTKILPVYGVTLTGVGELTTETSDVSEGVSYMLTVTNTGNTDDVIDLVASDDAAATLSQDSVSLAAGASTEVTLTVSDAVLTTAGDYEVKVTATSQGDNTKTAAVSTTTTILPVYGVTLTGVDELTTKTSDASEGVSYTLKITNISNTDDVIDLTTSGDAAALSQTVVSLAAGASAEIILTISGDDLAIAGQYEVNVTATSQVDKTKTAVISTKTTILPVYDVTLAGVGDLTTETSDASEGVSYVLTVTNTGNTDDIIDLTSSNDAATLSQASVSLAGGASAEVTITISGDTLATAGDYEVKITATSQGDNTMSSEVTTNTTILPVYGVTLAGVDELTTKTSDASEGVSYMLTVTNTGNTDDIIDLVTSGDAAATLSQDSVSLAAGASTEVTLTVSDAVLTTAGDYEVKVTTTSQGDNTKTAAVSTTTTILPVYGVTLAGVDELTTKTSDASEGVSYMLTVTNTGNTDDIIDLVTSGDAAATLSQDSVSLAAGASTEVTLTVSDAVLTTAGDYEVKVTTTSQGDNTKTAAVSTTTTILPVYGVTLTGVDELTTKTSDASEGVSYTLKITNISNTDDVIDLTTSGDAAATLSQTVVPLAAGASAEIILTISGDDLALASQYEVKVTATSQVDKTKTAVISTKTTILPVYGVTLTGVGDLMTETSDVSEGISYKFTVMNTGNTDDVIDLTSSDDAATLSQTSVSLAAGASAEVTITISGDALATAGDYEIKVTATSQGDEEKTDEVTTNTKILPVYGVTLAGVGDLMTETSDASEGISYMLTVTNTGNTDDMIDLTTSGDAAATLSQDSVSLTTGASTEVTLTVSDALLTTAGDYEVKVTATSQGDNTKTAAVSTTTTILPVYGVTLTGVDELTTKTSDASEGVSYTLKITNISNTDDVIDLTTSGDAAATLSQTVVPLAAGASAEIILTISGDDLALASQYEVKVTATSQVDKTKTAVISTKTTIFPVYGVTLTGVGDLMTETSDASEGVSYMLTVTNTGNTDDVIDLTSSDDAAILSQASVSLAGGASTEVTITISGDALATAGNYEVNVTATSQGDNTMSSEVSTNTTILPVYGVTLTGVGELTTETTDASEGVSYMLTVTNTGNTDDVIDLTSSDDDAILSQASVSLAGGASTEVTITISGDALATAGNYEVNVTATSQGDNTMSSEVSTNTTILPVYGVTLAGVGGELTGTTMDMLAGVSYTLTVTNTGNTEDTVVLGSSAEFGIEGSVLGSFSQSDDQEPTTSQLEIMLAAGASAEVIFTAAGDFFTKPGEYEIKVTATSQSDSTKTAELTTNTTIEPVPWDLNADGTVNILDLVAVANQFGESGEGLSGDVNMDGEVNILDLVQVASYFGKTQAEIVQANQ